MKKNQLNKVLFLVMFLIFSVFPTFVKSQTATDFEDLVVPEAGFFNGQTQHSGVVGSTEVFEYYSGTGIFRVSYTLENGYNYWSGTAYSNQTDLVTPDWTNFSAYANYPNGGGANGSSNYAFGYMWNPNFVQPFSDTIRFQIPTKHDVNINGLYVTNSVWNFHYINGTDGSGAGKYSDGDFYKLIFRGLDFDGNFLGSEVEFFLADFTNGNSIIINDWTWVDLSALENASVLEIVFESSDEWTPSYYCIDNIDVTYSGEVNIFENTEKSVNIFPNPAKDLISISNSKSSNIQIFDITGKIIFTATSNSDNFTINISDFEKGIYIIDIKNSKTSFSEKFIKI